MLHDALRAAVSRVPVTQLNSELGEYVPAASLQILAELGLRGEVVFPIPSLLRVRPSLLGYYRLLYGISMKEFKNHGYGVFSIMEEAEIFPTRLEPRLPELCQELCSAGQYLVQGVAGLSTQHIHDLQLLTLGAQWRGARNVELGESATKKVRVLIASILGAYSTGTGEGGFFLTNDSGRHVTLIFAQDPDVCVIEALPDAGPVTSLSIEIKGGTDISNVHNRLGEAEKSHLKARGRGCTRFWTILGVDYLPENTREQSPTSQEFFLLGALEDSLSTEFKRFRELLCATIGIRVTR